MRIVGNYCKNCGAGYQWQASGHYDRLGIPRQFQDREYCPTCKEAVINALEPIPMVTETKFVITDQIGIETLLQNEKAKREELDKTALFPLLRQVRMSPDSPITGGVKMKINEWDWRTFSYSYPEGHPELAEIRMLVRIDIATQKIIDYA